MSNPIVSGVISDEDKQAIKDAIATVKEKLPFLVSLTVKQRKATFKAGPNSLSFVQNALQAGQNNPDILPNSFKLDNYAATVKLFSDLTELFTVCSQLTSEMDDTRLAVGGQAMRGGTNVYNYVKAAVNDTPGLKPVADQLGVRFQHASQADGTPNTPATAPK